MKPVWVPLVVILTACEPPDPFELPAEPSIEILYPPDGMDIPLDEAGGSLRFTLVVSVDDLLLVDPNETTGNIVGEGHYHLYVNEGYEGPVHETYVEFSSARGQFAEGAPMAVRVSLANNSHGDLDQFDHWEDTIEFRVAPPESR